MAKINSKNPNIYITKNKISGKFYVGKSINNGLEINKTMSPLIHIRNVSQTLIFNEK